MHHITNTFKICNLFCRELCQCQKGLINCRSSQYYIGAFAESKSVFLASFLQHYAFTLCRLLHHFQSELLSICPHTSLVGIIDPCCSEFDTSTAGGKRNTPSLAANSISCLNDKDRKACLIGGGGCLEATETGTDNNKIVHVFVTAQQG